MSEQRIIEIETKLAYQESLMVELNDVVTEQQNRIMQLELLCKSLVERVRAVADRGPEDATQDERPPHY